ncbi:hypothetical protein N7G274_005979 [Stereocaulon virgatum]|uniref:BHLH domain-containing protein n=1 Tax=Stereocaulon virgatum TaxID=373712 RepID=A0ABR4A6E9_9LECA
MDGSKPTNFLESPSSRGLLPQGYASQPELATRLQNFQPSPNSNYPTPTSHGGSFPWDRDLDTKRRYSCSQSRSPSRQSWSFFSAPKADSWSRRGFEYQHSPSTCHDSVGGYLPASTCPREPNEKKLCHDCGNLLSPVSQSHARRLNLEVRSPSQGFEAKSSAARDIQLPWPHEHQTQPGFGFPLNETKLSRKRRQTVSQLGLHPLDDASLSPLYFQTTESTRAPWAGGDKDQKISTPAMVAHKDAEKNRRLEQDVKKKVIERLLPESSLDKKNNRWGNTKAGILEGAILVLDGLSMEAKIEAVKKTLTKKDRGSSTHECVESRARRRCQGECGLVQLPSMHTPPPSNHSSPGRKREAPRLTADVEPRSTNTLDHLWVAPLAPVQYQ